MGDPTHLEQMGRELKCPICLSLLSSAVSLGCNHVFCNSCIVKSMKLDSNCPVCKVPYRRREVCAAPHMDNLVSIYKSMEVASGYNIFVTQNAPPTKLSDEQKQVDHWNINREGSDGICQDRTMNQRKSKRKALRKTIKSNEEISDTVSAKPSFPTKKRVHVPKYPLSENPTWPEKLETGSGQSIKDGLENTSVVLKENPIANEKGKPLLSPFFWLRDEEDVEKSTQHSDGDQLLFITPPNVPTFSDIKDSDDENPSKSSPTGGGCGTSNVADFFDSEMFEWTQRACSPELFSLPVKMQAEDTGEIDGIQESKSKEPSLSENTNIDPTIENGEFGTIKEIMDVADVALPSISSLGAKSPYNLIGSNKSNRRGRNSRQAILKKCNKKNAAQNLKVPIHSKTDSGKILQKKALDNKGSSSNLEKTRKRSKKGGFITSVTESGTDNIHSVSVSEETLNLGDEVTVSELPASLAMEQGTDEDHKLKKAVKVCGKTSEQCQADCSLRSKKRKPDSVEVNMIEEVCTIQSQLDEGTKPQVSFQAVPVVDDKSISDTKGKPNKHGKGVRSALSAGSNQELSYSKNVMFSFDGISEARLADKPQEGHSNISAKETLSPAHISNFFAMGAQSTELVQGNINTRIQDNSVTLGKLCQANGVALHKCKTFTHKIHCAFCLSSEDSEAFGEMVHYYNGRPVAADHNSGSKIVHTHRNCAEWAPNVYFEDDTAINLEAELARSRRIKCCCCGLKGAALGCYEKSCRKSFHVPCAKLIPECRWDTDNFVMLCPLHASSKLPNESPGCQEGRRKKCVPKGQISNPCNQVVPKHDAITRQCWNSCVTSGKLVLCCSALTVGEREIVSEFERLCGVKVMKNWDLSVTHVIASTNENGACRRTLKVLMGILEGKWILNIEWVTACMKAMKPIEEEQYEITVDIHGIKDGPRLGRLRQLNKQPKIFEGFKFYFMGDFIPSYKGYIQDLLIAGGGTILHRKPISGSQGTLSLGCPVPLICIIYSLELSDKCEPSKKNGILDKRQSDAKALASTTGAKAVSNSWVLNSIAACKLQSFAE